MVSGMLPSPLCSPFLSRPIWLSCRPISTYQYTCGKLRGGQPLQPPIRLSGVDTGRAGGTAAQTGATRRLCDSVGAWQSSRVRFVDKGLATVGVECWRTTDRVQCPGDRLTLALVFFLIPVLAGGFRTYSGPVPDDLGRDITFLPSSVMHARLCVKLSRVRLRGADSGDGFGLGGGAVQFLVSGLATHLHTDEKGPSDVVGSV